MLHVLHAHLYKILNGLLSLTTSAAAPAALGTLTVIGVDGANTSPCSGSIVPSLIFRVPRFQWLDQERSHDMARLCQCEWQ